MKKIIPTILAFLIGTSLWSDNYKILQMNTKSIRIGQHICKKGDMFSDDSTIHWDNAKQALKAQNMDTKRVHLFVSMDFQNKRSKSIKEYYIKNHRLSSRGFGLTEMIEELSDTFYLLDTIRIDSPVPADRTRYFYISFLNHNKKEKIVLPIQNDQLLIMRSQFPMADKESEVKLSVAYSCDGIDEDYLLTDSMKVIFIPKRIKRD